MEQESTPVETSPEVSPSVESAPTEIAQDASAGNSVDWWNPDTWGKTPPKEIVKQIQSKYNETATKAKTLEKDYQAAQRELEQVVNEVKASLADERIYKEQRRRLGYETTPEVKPPELDFSKFETVGDVVNAFQSMKTHFETRIADIEKRAESRAESKIREAVNPISRERWSLAIDGMKSKYGKTWDSVERKVVNAITNGRVPYVPGQEKEVLDKAFRAECPEEYEAIIAEQALKRAAEKSKAITAAPRVQTPKTKPNGTDAEAIIARVNARLAK